MNKLGILISSPGHDQKFITLAHELNLLKTKRPDIDVIVFYYDYGQIRAETQFSMMEMKHAYNYDGVMIATDSYTAQMLNHCLRPKAKYLYIWNLDWKYTPTSFALNKKIYLNPEIDLISRSGIHHNIITKVWKEPKYQIEEFNHDKITRHFFSK